MKIDFDHKEITCWLEILKYHYNIICEIQFDHNYKAERNQYKMLGIVLNQIIKKMMKKAMDNQFKRSFKIEFTDMELWAFLHCPWEGMNNEYLNNITNAMAAIAHKHFVDITLEKYGQHNIKLISS